MQKEKNAVKCAVETGGGKEGVSRKDVGNDGKRTIFAWDVGILSPRKKQSKEVSRAGGRRKAGRNTRSVAAGIASQRILGASEMLPGHGLHRTDDEERLHRLKEWHVGRM